VETAKNIQIRAKEALEGGGEGDEKLPLAKYFFNVEWLYKRSLFYSIRNYATMHYRFSI
jgi:hypothetical protein